MIFSFIAILCLVEFIFVIANGQQEQVGPSHHATPLGQVATNNNFATTAFASTSQTIEYLDLSVEKEPAEIMASEQNKEYFNKQAASYDSKHEKTLNRVLEEIRARLDFIGVDWASDEDSDESDADDEKKGAPAAPAVAALKKQVRLLDYACGTGLVSRALAPYTTQCVGIDLSENMVDAYNTRAENQGLTEDEMHAYQGNLCVPSDPNPETLAAPVFFNFDIAAVGLGFHHFDDPALAAQRLVERLNPGGVLLVLDFLAHDKLHHSHHEASHTVTHHGFSEEEIKKMFIDAGAGKDFALQSVGVVFNFKADDHEGTKRQIFLARGTKA